MKADWDLQEAASLVSLVARATRRHCDPYALALQPEDWHRQAVEVVGWRRRAAVASGTAQAPDTRSHLNKAACLIAPEGIGRSAQVAVSARSGVPRATAGSTLVDRVVGLDADSLELQHLGSWGSKSETEPSVRPVSKQRQDFVRDQSVVPPTLLVS